MLTIAVTVALLLFPGCHGSGEPGKEGSGVQEQERKPAAQSSSTVQPDPAAALGKSDGTSPEEQAATPRLTLPEGFPATVPLLPHRRIRSFSPREDGSVSLTYSVPKDRQEAAVLYRESLAILRWEVTLDSLSGGMTTLSARQENGSRLTVNIIENPAEQLTIIGLYHQPPQE